MADNKNDIKYIQINKKAYRDFNILQTLEAGIALKGTEVKSIKDGKINFKDGFGYVKNGECFLKNIHISQYPFGNRINHDPVRDRKLLLHKREILKLSSKINEKGFTLVPLKIYIKRGIIKVEMGLASGKTLFNKKEDIRKKDEIRDLKRNFKLTDLSGRLK